MNRRSLILQPVVKVISYWWPLEWSLVINLIHVSWSYVGTTISSSCIIFRTCFWKGNSLKFTSVSNCRPLIYFAWNRHLSCMQISTAGNLNGSSFFHFGDLQDLRIISSFLKSWVLSFTYMIFRSWGGSTGWQILFEFQLKKLFLIFL